VGFDFARRTEEEVAPAVLGAALARGLFCWVDVDCGGCPDKEADCRRCADVLAALGINDLARSEVMGPDREGRYDVYEDCLHFAVTEGRLEGSRLKTTHVDIVLSERFLVTFRRTESDFIKQMRRTYREDFLKFAKTPGFLLYEIGDHLTERYRRALHGFGEAVEQTQLKLFADVDDDIFRHVADLTSDILILRKITLASRELFHELGTRKSPFIPEATQPFLENLAGALDRLGGDLTTEREVLNETLNLYMGMVSHKTNKVVNRLTVLSTIFLPLSFLCGVYGVNLKGVPEFGWEQGYLFFWSLCLVIAGTLLLVMRRRKWL
jgi:magnesium transporter